MLKRTTTALMGLLVSGYACAGMYSQPPAPTCVPGDVTVPCAASMWDIGIEALYLKSVVDADKGYRLVNSATPTNQAQYGQVQNAWDWGFFLEGAYHFSTGNDATLSWTHYSADNKQYDFRGFPGDAPFTFPYELHVDTRYDQLNAVLGQHVNVGMLDNMRFYGGLQYANIHYNLSDHYGVLPVYNTSVVQFVNSNFNGFGPLGGVDYCYDIKNGLSVTANAAASILYGTSRYNGGVELPAGLILSGNYATKHSFVPGLEGKLGLNYAYMLSGGVLNITGGYQVTNYFNALQARSYANAATMEDSDYSLYGPYLGLRWVANT